ncbi:uncharacterized protein MYCFIDRAFT_75674 [Pseudocercospora fijiensis CIRAD86]|uniref:Nucleolar protein 16 n=1 Tax=Pseudocercospora fijiensis (strain CIRAD86) TaxID=383855 RepID=N1Q6B4_PSEFD|nr:uncharacterized protein MYCFIDRAFT_75674 [Pseudocercospora fijiensis CIRAD86]EME87840.1 hypothetical protein MYCFIDRAFT_75674 [Pseudocercospora fijiensis CIRAD86]
MGREIQKRKNRSSISKVRQKPKSKKRIQTNPIIAQSWNKNETLAQNYKRLGLTVKLNKSTGGTEKKVSDILNDVEEDVDPLNITTASKRKKEQIDVSEAKIERDPETGKIIRVVDEKLAKPNPLNDPLNDLESDDEEEEWNGIPNSQHLESQIGEVGAQTETVKALEAAARRPAAKHKRRQPEGEVRFLRELVEKYGEDYGKMARDTKINYMQRSEGDLKKRIKKLRDSSGLGG